MVSIEILDHVHDLILFDQSISGKIINKRLKIFSNCVAFMIHEQLGIQKLSVLKYLNAELKQYPIDISILIF